MHFCYNLNIHLYPHAFDSRLPRDTEVPESGRPLLRNGAGAGAGYIRCEDLRRLLHCLDRDLPHWLVREVASLLVSVRYPPPTLQLALILAGNAVSILRPTHAH